MAGPKPNSSLILTTVAGEGDAVRLAEALVTERLAACVQWHAVASCYRWRGTVERAAEVRLQIKTARVDDAIVRLRALHPYDLPEIVVLEGRASSDYAAWIAAESASEQ